jgi:hypothetical protein
VPSSGQSAATEVVQAVQAPLHVIPGCADAVCGKGSPTPPAPTPMVALAAMIGGLAFAAVAAARVRRHRSRVEPLPAGASHPPFHPPQFS